MTGTKKVDLSTVGFVVTGECKRNRIGIFAKASLLDVSGRDLIEALRETGFNMHTSTNLQTMGRQMREQQAADLQRFGTLIARCRREARPIIAGGEPNMRYRLGLIGERLIAAFDEIDAHTTREQRLMLIGANPADAREVEPGHDAMLHLLWANNLEWSAMRRGEKYVALKQAPLYWCVSSVILDWMNTDEARPHADAAWRDVFGATFEELVKRSDA